jgi:hypothetical protein
MQNLHELERERTTNVLAQAAPGAAGSIPTVCSPSPHDLCVTRYLHTMYRIIDPEKSRGFYEALGFEFRRDLPIVRDGELEATNYFIGVPAQQEELELTYNCTAVYALAIGRLAQIFIPLLRIEEPAQELSVIQTEP